MVVQDAQSKIGSVATTRLLIVHSHVPAGHEQSTSRVPLLQSANSLVEKQPASGPPPPPPLPPPAVQDTGACASKTGEGVVVVGAPVDVGVGWVEVVPAGTPVPGVVVPG